MVTPPYLLAVDIFVVRNEFLTVYTVFLHKDITYIFALFFASPLLEKNMGDLVS
jgi:hypothetical protein